jgi:hypothetical protein
MNYVLRQGNLGVKFGNSDEAPTLSDLKGATKFDTIDDIEACACWHIQRGTMLPGRFAVESVTSTLVRTYQNGIEVTS